MLAAVLAYKYWFKAYFFKKLQGLRGLYLFKCMFEFVTMSGVSNVSWIFKAVFFQLCLSMITLSVRLMWNKLLWKFLEVTAFVFKCGEKVGGLYKVFLLETVKCV